MQGVAPQMCCQGVRLTSGGEAGGRAPGLLLRSAVTRAALGQSLLVFDSRTADHISCMTNETDHPLKITGDPPFWWEIYRGDDPQWVGRSMVGYLIEKEALQDRQAALQHLANREAQARRIMKPTDKAS
jgi:hypothetical protein